MRDNDPLAFSLPLFFRLRSESGPCGNVNQRRVEKLRPPSPVFLRRPDRRRCVSRASEAFTRAAEQRSRLKTIRIWKCLRRKVSAPAAANWKVNLL